VLRRHRDVRPIARPSFLTLLLGICLVLAACSSGSDTTDTAAPAAPTATEVPELPSLVPQPSPTPFVLPTIVPTVGPTPTTAVDQGEDADPEPTPTAVAVPSSTPRPIPTAAPTSTPVPPAAPTAVVVQATPRPVRPTATAIAPTATPQPTTPAYVEVGCTISDRSIVVDEVIVLKAFQNPGNVPITYSFDHGDGTIDPTAESYAYYRAPGRYDVIMRWQHARQTGSTFCGTVVVTGSAGPTPTPTPAATVEISCSVSDREIVVGEVITLQATHNPANVPVAYVFDHGDGTLDPTSRSQAYYRQPGFYAVQLEWAHSGKSGTMGCGTVTVKPNTSIAGYLALTPDQAAARATSDGLTLRVVRVDNQSFPGTTDYRLDRVNIEVDNGIVTKVYLG